MSQKQDNSVQVRLIKWADPTDNQNPEFAVYTCYIPEEYAIQYKTLQIKQEDGTWEDGWIVSNVFNKLPSAIVRERSQDYKKTRKASDI